MIFFLWDVLNIYKQRDALYHIVYAKVDVEGKA